MDEANCVRVQCRQPKAKLKHAWQLLCCFVLLATINSRPFTGGINLIWTVVEAAGQ